MTEKDIFERLFSLIPLSNDTNGAVSACLVREGKIVAEGISNNESVHAEDALLRKLVEMGEVVQESDTVYVTVEPCGKRTPGGRGEKMGDCTTNLIKAGVKRVVYAASDPHASDDTRHKFAENSASLSQASDRQITAEAIRLFNTTCTNTADWLPLG
jgi:pyrimidine deaminase RibD-like protein